MTLHLIWVVLWMSWWGTNPLWRLMPLLPLLRYDVFLQWFSIDITKKINKHYSVFLVIGGDLQSGSSPRVHLPETIYTESGWYSSGASSTLQPCCWRSFKWGWRGRGGPSHVQPTTGRIRDQQTVSATWTVWHIHIISWFITQWNRATVHTLFFMSFG